MASREARSRSPRGDAAAAGILRTLDVEKMQLKLEARVAKVMYFKEDDIWFEAKPLVLYLEYSSTNVTQTLGLVKEKNKKSLKELLETRGQPKGGVLSDKSPGSNELKALYINEPGLYSLIFRSTKKQAQEFQDWVYEEVLTALRRRGSYQVPGSAQLPPEAVAALGQLVQDSVASAAATAAAAAVAQVQRQHGVLEISRSSGGARSAQLQLLGTPVDDGQLRLIAIEGGPLYVSEFLREMKVPPELRRRLMPSFAAEAARRKLIQWQAAASEGSAAPPLWTAWSQGAWRHYYTEADRALLSEVFEDPLTRQQLEALAPRPARARAAAPAVARQRQGPYARALQGGSSAVSSQSIRSFFGPPRA